MKRQLVRSTGDLDRLERLVSASANFAAQETARLLDTHDGIDALAILRFTDFGRDPIDANRSLNFIEQLNQTYTYLASIMAARWLLTMHPEDVPFVLNLGTRGGTDVESDNGRIAAETFAATKPASNNKLNRDIERVSLTKAEFKYVFYLCPIESLLSQVDEVKIVHLRHPALNSLESLRNAR